jgi:ferric-dicitrate binding protein FerR (iron transport regulator)
MEEVVSLLYKYFSAVCTEEEKLQAEAWIEKSAENKKLYSELKGIWQKAENADNIVLHHKQAWERIKQGTGIVEKDAKVVRMGKWSRSWVRVAAALVILIGIGIVMKLTILDKTDMITVTALNTAKHEVTLPDGSVVCLNRGSQLAYAEDFVGETREVTLEGEAFFQVSKDPQHPFIVHAKGTNTKVLGTSFNINTCDAHAVKISVFSGKVAFSQSSDAENLVKLVKGECAVFENEKSTISKLVLNNENDIAWQTGVLKFANTPLVEAARDMSDFYGRPIEIDSSLRDRFISVTFNNLSLNNALEIIELTLNVKADTSLGKVVIRELDMQ